MNAIKGDACVRVRIDVAEEVRGCCFVLSGDMVQSAEKQHLGGCDLWSHEQQVVGRRAL